MSAKNTRDNSRNVARAIAFGSLVLSIFCILLGLILFVIGPLQKSQDIRQRAMTPTGTAQLEFSPKPGTSFPAAETGSFDIKLIPYTVIPTKVTFVFDLITHETIDVTDVLLNPQSGIRKELLEFKKVDHGYTVTFIGQFPDGGAHSAEPNTAQTILTVKFQQKKAGKLQVNFDRERSKLIAVSNSQQIDELRTSENFEYTITPPATQTTTGLDDLYFKTLDSSNTKLTFYQTGTSTEVSANALQPGKQYEVEHTAAIQNSVKNTTAPTTPVNVELKINNQTYIRNTLVYRDLTSKTEGESVTIKGVFTAAQKNTFVVSIDPDNVYPEQKEDNNAWQTTTEYSTTVRQCNETCNSNSDCKADQRCYDNGSEKRCRLVTNVTSTSCSAAPDQGLRRSCNQYCADTRECAAGLTCWYNKCRLLQNLESTSCRMPRITLASTGGTTKGGITTASTSQPITYQSCNEPCRSNRDCAAGLRCYKGSCRNPLNVSSSACNIADAVTATPAPSSSPHPTATPKPTATPSVKPTATPTPKPTTSASPKPSASPTGSPRPTALPTPTPILTTKTATPSASATPSATPVATPDLSSSEPTTTLSTNTSQALWARITAWFGTLPQVFSPLLSTYENNPEVYGIATPYIVIGAGALFLIIAFLLLIFGRKKQPMIPTATELSQQSGAAAYQPQKNPTPPKEVLQRRVSPDPTLIKSVAPQVAPQPQTPSIPAAPQQQRLDSVLQELKNKHQASSAPTTPAQTPLTPLPTQPPVSPEELLKQDADHKVSMADRLKLKGVGFNSDIQNQKN